MTQRILSISGLRGVVGDGLDPEFLTQFAAALGTLVEGGVVVLTRDGRATGTMVQHAVLSGLLATGCRVIDGGIASTPTCGVLVKHVGATAGLQITASHNPVEWNGLKPFSSEGAVFNHGQGQALIDVLESRMFRWQPWDKVGVVKEYTNSAAPHMDRVVERIDLGSIRNRSFKVVLDCNRGSGGIMGPRLLEALGCEIKVLGGEPDGQFEHTPEPLKENLTVLCDAVAASNADVGFAQDPDADRLAVVDENGTYIGEELTLALAADHLLAQQQGPFVVNGSTSRVTEDIAKRHGCEYHRSHVGEANVVAMMKETGAVLGGEGNGGVIDPQIGFVRDSFVSMALILEGLQQRSGTLSEWVASLPSYCIIKDKVKCPAEFVQAVCDKLKSKFADATGQEGDGLRLDWDDRWVQVRASNTEPIVRVIAEAPTEKEATQLCAEAKSEVSAVISEGA